MKKIKFINKYIYTVILCIITCFALTSTSVVALSDNNSIVSVKFSVGQLGEEFTPKTVNYDLTVPKGTEKIEVEAVASDPGAKVSVGGKNLATGKIVITVIAPSGAKKYYTFFVKYSDKVAPVTTTTSTKVTTTTTKRTSNTSSSSDVTKDSEVSDTSEVEEPIDSSDSTSDTSNDSTLDYLSVKGNKLLTAFNSKTYEYSINVDDISDKYEVEYIPTSTNAHVTINFNKSKYVIEVTNKEDKSVYIINLKQRSDMVSTDKESQKFSIIKNSLFAMVLLLMAILLFAVSKKLKA